ncbi:Uncharacterised protein [Leclercia adecarboxylata]|uniref:Uncharacterized protein n=1 Tax=Leclercia adecarboxylata TaxID=83655 RepID=A0A4U9HVL1_9ENTR|nr:Uncharacterised protein [Leclercia adecarboxylata]
MIFRPLAAADRPYLNQHCKSVEALRLRKQQSIVETLAIPQVNDEGDRVDWYSPTEGTVISWKAADEDARFRALRLLESTLSSVESLSKKSLQSPKNRPATVWFPAVKSVSVPGGKLPVPGGWQTGDHLLGFCKPQ